jgi:hypothetical protein
LIDLYDGNHPAMDLNSDRTMKEIYDKIDKAISERKHQAFMFHKVGSKSLMDYARKIITGYNYNFEEEQFLEMIKYMNSRRDKIWVAPLIQILKYQSEYEASKLELIKKASDKIVMKLSAETDPELYDQDLTLKLPSANNILPVKILQNNTERIITQLAEDEFIANIKPVNSEIVILYK